MGGWISQLNTWTLHIYEEKTQTFSDIIFVNVLFYEGRKLVSTFWKSASLKVGVDSYHVNMADNRNMAASGKFDLILESSQICDPSHLVYLNRQTL